MFVYKENDCVSNSLIKHNSYEGKIIENILQALEYFRNKNQIKNNKDIYILDIGGNIGLYPSFFGRFGYSILSFEVLERNYYLSKKNYCLNNKGSNVVLINKGLYTEEKKCGYYTHIGNIGNGMILCNETKNKTTINKFYRTNDIYLTKLSNFIPYLSNKKIALIKIDVEGSEGKVLESGLELITKYHVPYIIIEFTPKLLKRHETEPKYFLELFLNNGYKIMKDGFFSDNYLLIDNIYNISMNLYLKYK